MTSNDSRVPLDLPVSVTMRQLPVTVPPSATVADVMFRMRNENIGAVIVVDDGRPVGIITERDVLRRAIQEGKDVYTTHAQEVMSTPLLTIEAERPIKEALELMRAKTIRRLAVTKHGALVGLATERRLLEAIVRWGYAM